MRSAITFLAFAAGTIVADAHARPPSSITKIEARSLPASQVKRRVMDQLSDLLSEERFAQRRPPKNPLTDMMFVTKPRAASVPGLCQIDRLRVTFQSKDGERGDATTPVSVDGFSSTSYFHFTRPPSAGFGTIDDEDHALPDDSACRGAKLWDDEFFTAPDERVATDGYLLAHRVMDAIVAGNPSFALACEKFPVEENRECAEIIREIRSAQISDIERCETDLPEFRSTVCYRIFIGDRSLRVIASSYAYGPNVLPPLTVKRVDLDSLIIMAHERVD